MHLSSGLVMAIQVVSHPVTRITFVHEYYVLMYVHTNSVVSSQSVIEIQIKTLTERRPT